jgi:anti-sigma B factor antagonist
MQRPVGAGVNDRLYLEVSQLIPSSKRILLNLTDLTHMDSTGLGMLVRLYVSAKSAGCALQLFNIGRPIRQLLGATPLLPVFEVIGNNNIRCGRSPELFSTVDLFPKSPTINIEVRDSRLGHAVHFQIMQQHLRNYRLSDFPRLAGNLLQAVEHLAIVLFVSFSALASRPAYSSLSTDSWCFLKNARISACLPRNRAIDRTKLEQLKIS